MSKILSETKPLSNLSQENLKLIKSGEEINGFFFPSLSLPLCVCVCVCALRALVKPVVYPELILFISYYQ